MNAGELRQILNCLACDLEIRLPDDINNEIIGICVGQDEKGDVVGFLDFGKK